MSLSDVGTMVILDDIRGQPMVEVVMVIEAPRGICTIWKSKYQSEYGQVEAIRAFMEEHRND